MSATEVFLVALGTALATGLGVLAVVAVRRRHTGSIVVANAIAAGFMLGATVGLIYEGAIRSVIETAFGAAAGILFIAVTRTLIGRNRPDRATGPY